MGFITQPAAITALPSTGNIEKNREERKERGWRDGRERASERERQIDR